MTSPTAAVATPDGRYIVVRGRLWRATNPGLAAAEKERLVASLMSARRQLRGRAAPEERAAARAAVDAAKVALGERGPPWWDDGAPDFNRRMVRNTPYAAWFASVDTSSLRSASADSTSSAAARLSRR